jgi:DNA-binding NarL/FixJ family response regulator
LLIATGEFSAAAEFFDRQPIRWRSDGTGVLQLPDGPVDIAVWQRQFHEARERYEHGLHLVSGSEELMPEARLCVAALRGEADAITSSEAEADEAALQRSTTLIKRLRSLGAARPPRSNGFGSELAALVAVGEAEYQRLSGPNDPQAWATAARLRDELGMPYHAAYARTRQAEALIAQGGRVRASASEPAGGDHREHGGALLTNALSAATDLGAAPLADLIRTIQTSAGLTPPTRSPVEPGAPDGTATSAFGLTEREREVASVLVRGLSNREIAEQLFIAEGTASVHVSRILRKLGVTSRGQAIALLLQQGDLLRQARDV